MILIKGGKIIMPAAMDADQGNLAGVYFLQGFTVPDGDQPVFCAMNDIGMAFHFGIHLSVRR